MARRLKSGSLRRTLAGDRLTIFFRAGDRETIFFRAGDRETIFFRVGDRETIFFRAGDRDKRNVRGSKSKAAKSL